MAVSVFDLFKIGIGPSSSHTVGPMKAARMFVQRLDAAGLLARVARVEVQLYGSLGHTSESAGKKTEAKAAFANAVAIWEKLAAATSNDEAVQTGLTWSKGRLAKIK